MLAHHTLPDPDVVISRSEELLAQFTGVRLTPPPLQFLSPFHPITIETAPAKPIPGWQRWLERRLVCDAVSLGSLAIATAMMVFCGRGTEGFEMGIAVAVFVLAYQLGRQASRQS